MIALCHPDPNFGESLLDRNGGFVWWYIDVVDAAGDGVVLIWSYGLPFLPGYRTAALRGDAETPRSMPSLNVVVYRGGEPVFYSLERYGATDASLGGDGKSWAMGASRMTIARSAGRIEVEVDLDIEVAGQAERLRGRIALSGAVRAPRPGDRPAEQLRHGWTPIAPCATGRFDLACGALTFAGSGFAYFDANAGDGPFCSFGIADWTWARASSADQTRIVYLVNGARSGDIVYIGVIAHSDGRFETVPLQVRAARVRRDRWGVRHATSLVLDAPDGEFATVELRRIVDRGPFYLRMLVSMTFDGVAHAGWAEVVCADRIDLALHRPLVRMRVADHTGRNSFWLPLFSGPVRGRLKRLFGQLGQSRPMIEDAAGDTHGTTR